MPVFQFRQSIPAPHAIPQFRVATQAFRPGDHVRVSRGLYWHHAIIESWDSVIEFGVGLSGGEVQRVAMSEFAAGGRIELVNRGGAAAVSCAQSQLGLGDFSLLTRNCEHFATWCATGRWESQQVQAAVAVGGLVLVLMALSRPSGFARAIA